MRTMKPATDERTREAPESERPDSADESGTYEIYRVECPDCRQPIALLAQEETLPPHGLCATPWDPFGLTSCEGAGRSAADARPLGDDGGPHEGGAAELLALPEGLDWRMQPFSHAGVATALSAAPRV
ncbi:hypothetical protein [Streptomyces xiaopingdaonensis]|uniref:hypothetical protein n=1 Tax=Streptomyces xiaopingdaonensis TaxID=1565415 RepID=UPI0002DB5DDD|nr:hypothetical protein [Streptomyces xiaopingdaonensis]